MARKTGQAILAGMAILIFCAFSLPARAQEKPLSKDQVLSLVRNGLGDETGAKAVKERGIHFAPTEDFLQSLKDAGAKEDFIAALRSAGSAVGNSTPSGAAPPEEPPVIDLSKLKLRVTNAEVVNEITLGSGSLSGQEKFSAPKGRKLVVVTLEGRAPVPCRFASNMQDFEALYEEETTVYPRGRGQPSQKRLSVHILQSRAVNYGNSGWDMPPEGFTIEARVLPPRPPGPVVIKIAVSLPEKVRSFMVRYPTVAEGTAVLP